MVIAFLEKDYELQSWNEQGEITKIEGMLTIAFLVVSSCSHIDTWKQLYCIIKIPYMVSMSSEDVDEKNDVRIVKHAEPMLTPELYHQQNEKIKELSSKIEKLEAEIEILKKENLRLKIISGEAKSGWKKDRNMIERDNPDTGKLEFYKCPINFDHDKVVNLKYLDEKRLMVSFFHKGMDEDWGTFEMATDAYLWLCGELPEQKKKRIKKSKIQKLEFKEKDDIIKYLEESDEDIDDLEYLDNVIDFLWERKGKKFGTNDFQRECKIGSSSTVQIYLKMLVRCNIIVFLKKGWYKVNIK